MEMVINAGFYALCGSLPFGFRESRQDQQKRQDINHAVLAAESLTEEIKGWKYREFWNFLPDGIPVQF